jgi:outer membrane protein assembly factor BamB
MVSNSGQATPWTQVVPRKLWSRPLGDGHSQVLAEGKTLYTMYRNGEREIVLSADAESGKTLWEHSWQSTFRSEAPELGHGPHATPLVVGDRLFAPGVAGHFVCLDKKTGKVLWTKELWKELHGTRLVYGYASHPISFRDTVIIPVGGQGRAVVALRVSDGSVLWQRGDYQNAYSSPLLIRVDGLDQLVMVFDGMIAAFNPINGDPQWEAAHRASYGLNVSAPLWTTGNLLFLSSEYDAGGQVLELTKKAESVAVKQLWHSPKIRLHHGNALRYGDIIYLPSGGKSGPCIFTAVEARTGRILWQDRNYPKLTMLDLNGKALILTEDGDLTLATLKSSGVEVHAKTSVLEAQAWTPPTLVGTRLYLRNRQTLAAYDLGPPVAQKSENRLKP